MIDPASGYYEAPSSAKVVIFAESEVLLCLNPRGEWELPGGRPDPGDRSLAEVVQREVAEETGIALAQRPVLVDAELFWPIPDKQVTLVCFLCRLNETEPVVLSHEHRDVRFFPVDALPDNLPETYRRFIAAAQHQV